MSSEEFWDSTFPEFNARIERHAEQQKLWNLRFGQLCATYVNTKLKEGVEPFAAGDFFGYPKEEEDDGEDYEMTPEETVAKVKAMFRRRG